MKSKELQTNFFLVKVVLIIVGIGILSFIKLSFNLANNNTPGLATLFINLETEKRFFEGEVVKDMTILDALSAAVLVGKIKFNYAIDKSGNVNVAEIDGQTNGIANKHFVFYLNSNKIAVKDLNKKEIRGGDEIEIRNE